MKMEQKTKAENSYRRVCDEKSKRNTLRIELTDAEVQNRRRDLVERGDTEGRLCSCRGWWETELKTARGK